jgi:lipoprotein-anchoring transpeptidase ErfK/SrfK
MRRALLIGAAALASAALLAAAGCSDDPPKGEGTTTRDTPQPVAGPIRLEKGVGGEIAWTARLRRTALARSAPQGSAPAWMEITRRTPYSGREAGFLVTGAYRERTGREWVRVQLATRPNGTTAWVPRRDVRLTATRYRIRVDLSERRLDLFRDGRRVASHPAGIGRTDYPTPTGTFAIEDALPSRPEWRAKYGGYVLTLTAFSNVLTSFMGGEGQSAIHGTGSLGRVGRPASFGCVVLGDAALRDLYRRVRPGTPVEIVA